MAFDARRIRAAYFVPDESQLRNPRHMQALVQSCNKRGVQLIQQCEVFDFRCVQEQVQGVITSRGSLNCKQLCLAGGAWSHQLLRKLNVATGILPVRGQMVLFACNQPPITHIINEGSRYLVPRDDGRVLAGSTEEEAGFCKETTQSAINELTNFATQLVPRLSSAQVERTWAGLRPGTLDGFPYLGRVPGFLNLFVAAGHFRSGLYLSPATAVAMAQLIQGKESPVDLSPFSVLRN
jgi:glycine oxidase